MAESPAHKLGQLIGTTLERALEGPLAEFARRHRLYLDKKGPRAARRGVKVTWTDKYNNKHDLDFVLERGGTDSRRGCPVAFIEVAWRRYTKHSRNKAQEIQGAIKPLRDTYGECAPFIGVVLAGVFTEGSLQQLRSHGFEILYFPYEDLVRAFRDVGVDIAYDERTALDVLSAKVAQCEGLGDRGLELVGKLLLEAREKEVRAFFAALEEKVVKKIKRVVIVALFGDVFEFSSLLDAISGLDGVRATRGSAERQGFEAIVEYTNGDRIDGRFETIDGLKGFLERMLG